MRPVWNHRITDTICFFVVTAYKAMAAALDGNGPKRYEIGMKPVWNRYETGYETGMKPIWNHRITHTICFFVVTAYEAMAAALIWNQGMKQRCEARVWNQGMKPGMKPR